MLGSSNSLSISNRKLSNSAASDFHVGGGLGVDYFVIDNFSVGFDAEAVYRKTQGYGATTLAEVESTSFAGGVRLGLNLPLREFSWYPRLTLDLASSHSTITPLSTYTGAPPGPPVSQSSVGPALNLYAPLLFHAVPHFVIGFGPRFQHDFAATRGGPYDGSQSTLLSAELTVGGWWGGVTTSRASPSDVAKPEEPAERLFGERGQIVLTTATDASIGYSSYSSSKGSTTSVKVAPSIDYFVLNGVSVGAEVAIGNSNGTSLDESGAETQVSSNSFDAAARIGANLRLAAAVSIWLRGAIGYGTVDQSISNVSATNQHSRTRSWIDISMPLLVHPASHFFVGAGPFIFHELSDKDQYEFENDATQLGLSLILGGWFGSEAH
jgi:hypothetical protein